MTAGIGHVVEILYTSAFFNVKKAEVNNIRLANTSLHQVY